MPYGHPCPEARNKRHDWITDWLLLMLVCLRCGESYALKTPP